MKINYENLQKKLNIKFKDRKLLIKCLTHKSFDKINNNEKIEFLGDRVLGLLNITLWLNTGGLKGKECLLYP